MSEANASLTTAHVHTDIVAHSINNVLMSTAEGSSSFGYDPVLPLPVG
jgi:hypothetical protein